ncbi:tRNA lysidine(34) synthetase TilS [Propioniciclava flava]|uniref:tRNA(Ile)-lysidine synthase n=1 Tax=Propioniciclava flava TaxID=2072026 RepID=A0A4Q2EH55_9ACTN|nr:tRNA lysidine(34) synthetase TilS [Propioniciclava flava]RXW32890.1 tRNA lysidine(34) synthetase TilS [Propioniciclava flava]
MARKALGPATLAVVQAVEALPAEPWVVACSGGADSLSLAWAAHLVAGRRGTSVRAVVVDHGLQAGSGEIAADVVRILASFNLDAQVVPVTVESQGNVEAQAREARYAALEREAGGDAALLLGHTLDDQAETVLLGLARGSGPRSLAGMAARRGRLTRPLLELHRHTTARACAEVGLEPWHDPMNADPHFARVRTRTRVLPMLERELGPGIAEALARTADLCRDAAEALDAAAAPLISTTLDVDVLASAQPGVRRAAIAAWLTERGAPSASWVHVTAVEALVTDWHGQRGIDVAGGAVLRKEGDLVYVPR